MRFCLRQTTRMCLRPAKLSQVRVSDTTLLRSIGTLPLRDRSLLQLFLNKGASQGELAGVLGVSRQRVAKILRQLLTAASDPGRLALVNAWHRLSPQQQRLAYLHLILGMPLREISRLGLISQRAEANGRPDTAVGRTTLGRLMRQIERKVQRIAAAAEREAHSAPATPPDR